MTRACGKFWLLALACAVSTQAIHAQAPERRFAGVIVYGTDIFDSEALTAEFADEADALMELMSGPMTAEYRARIEADAEVIAASIRESLASRGDFALLELGWGMDGGADLLTMVLTIEAVEEADRARRMPFRDPPTGSYEDPNGVFAAWQAEEDARMALMMSGELFSYQQSCPVLHCWYSFEPPELAPYLEIFNEAADEHEDLLYDIAMNDGDSEHRGRALLTLGHTDDTERLLPLLSRAIYDSSGNVRNVAMRIMDYMADLNPALPFPVADLIQAMDFPSANERNKAVVALGSLVAIPEHARIIREQGLPNMLKLLRTPGDLMHEPAYEILTALSGEVFAARDYEAWEA